VATATGLVLLGQATALVVALMSLDFGRNVFSPEIVVLIIGASFVVLFLSGLVNLLTRGVKREFMEALAKAREKSLRRLTLNPPHRRPILPRARTALPDPGAVMLPTRAGASTTLAGSPSRCSTPPGARRR
jgi:hypothetical protein